MSIRLLILTAFLWVSGFTAEVKQHMGPLGWHSVGKMEEVSWDESTLLFCGDDGLLAITPISDDIVRIRFTTQKEFPQKRSYTLGEVSQEKVQVTVERTAVSTSLITKSLQIKVEHDPMRLSIADASGEMIDHDDQDRGIALAGDAFRIAKYLGPNDHVYGFGQKNGRLDKRGWKLGGYHFVMWNSDTYCYDSSTDPSYVSVPFYMKMRQGKTHGVFLDNTWRSTFDVGREKQELLTFGAEGGPLDYYFIYGPHPKEVIKKYTELTGRAPLPPYWALGYHQCRWSYFPESKVRLLADTFRHRNIPIDAIWLDIHYQEQYKPFSWDRERFPSWEKMVGDLKAQGIQTVCIVDAHPKVEIGYEPYDTGIAGDHFVKKADGTVFEGPVWPSLAEKNPGVSVFPDFSRVATRKWWGKLHKQLLDAGVAGIWNDMNEPAVFGTPTGTLPLDVVHDNEGHPTDHREIHNVYGQLMTKATFEGLQALKPNERPFVLTRSTFAGGQKFSAVWNGDSASDWASLRQSVSTLLGMGISGFPFIGSDIGGFSMLTSAELFTRWLQVGVFFPFMRVHAEVSSPDKEPWVYGYKYELINKRAIELRYELLPYIYNVMHQASSSGIPAMRPLFLEFPEDEHTASIDHEFLFGSDLLVAPVLWEGVTEQNVYLPHGNWFDYQSNRQYSGGGSIIVSTNLDTVPMFVRAGGFIFHQPVIQHTGERIDQPLKVRIYPSKKSEAIFYEDDGATFNYREGVVLERVFGQKRDSTGIKLTVSSPQGSYRPSKKRSLIFEVIMYARPRSVSFQCESNQEETALPYLDMNHFNKAATGWNYQNNVLMIKDVDRYEKMSFSIH